MFPTNGWRNRSNGWQTACKRKAVSVRLRVRGHILVMSLTSPTGDGTAILCGHPSYAKVYPLAVQREYLHFSVILRPWVLVWTWELNPQPPTLQSHALLTEPTVPQYVSVVVLLTSEHYCKFKIFLMKLIGLGEDNDEDVQETNGDQSRTISVPEAVVTQILPPATGKYSMLYNKNLICINIFQTFCTVVPLSGCKESQFYSLPFGASCS